MKLISVFIIFTSLYNIGLSQDNQFRIRLNQLSFAELKEEVSVDDIDLIIVPEETDNITNFNIDFSIIKQHGNFDWVYRLGGGRLLNSGELRLARDTFYIVSDSKNSLFQAKVGFGLSKKFNVSNDKLKLEIGLIEDLQYSFKNLIEYGNSTFNQENRYLSGRNLSYDFVNSWRLNTNLNFGIHYHIFKRIALGVELNNILFFDFKKGRTIERRVDFDESRTIVDEILIHHDESNFRFGKIHNFSISVSFSIK